MKKDVFSFSPLFFQNSSCLYCTKLGTNMVQGENVYWWRENQVMLFFFSVALLVLAVGSQLNLNPTGRTDLFPFYR